MKILLVLGSPNDSNGNLSEMAKRRVNVCQELIQREPYKILLTGGFGIHFNVTQKPHAWYLKRALIASGIQENNILALIESGNSVEDATLSKWMIRHFEPEEILVITSDYHLKRAQLIFKTIFAPFDRISFVGASSDGIDAQILDPLIQHEKMALQDLLDNGVRF